MLARAILVLLIVLNVGAALWWIAHDSAPTAIEAVPPPGVARLQLVSERQAAPAPEPVAAPAPVATATVAGAAQCFSLGPFATRAAAETALARVQSLVQRAAVRTPVTQASASSRVAKAGRNTRQPRPALPPPDSTTSWW